MGIRGVGSVAIGACLWVALATSGLAQGGARQEVFQIRFAAGGTILAKERPFDKGTRMVFRRHPDGVLMSVKKSDVVEVVAVSIDRAARNLHADEWLEVGPTGEGAANHPLPPRPVEGAASTRILNPSIPVMPPGSVWILGLNVPFPPAPATQRGPGEPPVGVQSGPPPVRPN